MTAVTPAQAKLDHTTTAPPVDQVLEDLQKLRVKRIKEGTWPRWSERELRALATDAAAKRRHGYPISKADLRAQQTVAAYDTHDRGATAKPAAVSVPAMFRVHGTKTSDPLTCQVCGDPRALHSSDRCALCGAPTEHHDRDLHTGIQPVRFDDCLAGRIRMASARHAAGVALDQLDQLALAHQDPQAGAA